MVIKLWNQEMPKSFEELGELLSDKARDYGGLALDNINDNNTFYATQHGLIHSLFREAAGVRHSCNRESFIAYVDNWSQEILSEMLAYKKVGATRLFEDAVLTFQCLSFVLSCAKSVPIAGTNETINIDPSDKLTRDNVVDRLKTFIKDKHPTLDTMMKLSFYLDFAISTKDLTLINAVHNQITYYYLDAFQNPFLELPENCNEYTAQRKVKTWQTLDNR